MCPPSLLKSREFVAPLAGWFRIIYAGNICIRVSARSALEPALISANLGPSLTSAASPPLANILSPEGEIMLPRFGSLDGDVEPAAGRIAHNNEHSANCINAHFWILYYLEQVVTVKTPAKVTLVRLHLFCLYSKLSSCCLCALPRNSCRARMRWCMLCTSFASSAENWQKEAHKRH
jgi:hypothetical protein